MTISRSLSYESDFFLLDLAPDSRNGKAILGAQ